MTTTSLGKTVSQEPLVKLLLPTPEECRRLGGIPCSKMAGDGSSALVELILHSPRNLPPMRLPSAQECREHGGMGGSGPTQSSVVPELPATKKAILTRLARLLNR